jgi:hypothetical protein
MWRVIQGQVGKRALGEFITLAELTAAHAGDEAAAIERAEVLVAEGWLEKIEVGVDMAAEGEAPPDKGKTAPKTPPAAPPKAPQSGDDTPPAG